MMSDDIQAIIERVIKPRLKSECDRLGIPLSFIKQINAIYPKPFESSSLFEPMTSQGKIEGVRIRIVR